MSLMNNFHSPITVELAKEVDDDLLEQIDIATAAPPIQAKLSSDKDSSEPSVEPVVNGVNGKSNHSEHELLNESVSEEAADQEDTEMQNEDDLLKDLDDDQDIGKEMEDLLEYALEKDDKKDDPTEVEPKSEEVPEIERNGDAEKEIQDPTADEKTTMNDSVDDLVSQVDELISEADASEKTDNDKQQVDEKDSTDQSEKDVTDQSEKEAESKGDDLLVAMESPPACAEPAQQYEASISSSNEDDTPEDSCDGEKRSEKPDDSEVEEAKQAPAIESMDVDEMPPNEKFSVEVNNREADAEADDTDEEQLCIVTEREPASESNIIDIVTDQEPASESITIDPPKAPVPFKMNFMRKFSTAIGKLSRPELEEMLIEKITESIMFCSDNTDLRARLDKEEKIVESFKKRLENVKKQYNDLEMIHGRVMKDLKDRPDAPITPVKITRAVGLQVYQPFKQMAKTVNCPSTSVQFGFKVTNKRPMEDCNAHGGKGSFAENAKRKKTLKITPMRPPLSDKERASLDLEEAKEEQTLRTNVKQNVIGNSPVKPNITVTPINSTNGVGSSQSIDLTDDFEDSTSSSSAAQSAPTPPALVAIRGTNQGQPSPKQRIVVKPAANRSILQFRRKTK